MFCNKIYIHILVIDQMLFKGGYVAASGAIYVTYRENYRQSAWSSLENKQNRWRQLRGISWIKPDHFYPNLIKHLKSVENIWKISAGVTICMGTVASWPKAGPESSENSSELLVNPLFNQRRRWEL